MKAAIDEKPNAGMSSHLVDKPGKKNSLILKPGTTRVTMYKATADDTHLKRPKERRFRGRIRILIMGLTTRDEAISATPARRREVAPFSKTIPLAT